MWLEGNPQPAAAGTEPKKSKKSKKGVMNALTSLANAEKSDKVLRIMVLTLGIEVPFEKCRMYPRSNAELVAASSAKGSAAFEEGGHFHRIATDLNSREAHLVGDHLITPAMVLQHSLTANDLRTNAQIVEDLSSEMSRRQSRSAASRVGSQYAVEDLDYYFDGGVCLSSQGAADKVVGAIPPSRKRKRPGLTTGSVVYFASMAHCTQPMNRIYRLIKYSVSGREADAVSLNVNVPMGKNAIFKLLPVEKQDEYTAAVVAARKEKDKKKKAEKREAKAKANK